MKTMKMGDSVIRVKEEDVDKKLAEGYNYCPRKVWKDLYGRKAVLKEKAEEAKEKNGKN